MAAQRGWTAQIILRRGNLLLGFIEARWSIKFPTEQKIDLLNIDL